MKILLKDTQQHIEYKDYPTDNALQFMLGLKKIFPSIFDLLLPILPDDDKIDQLTWESTTIDFERFKRLVGAWATLEMRLHALGQALSTDHVPQILKQAQAERRDFVSQQDQLNLLYGDYVFLHTAHVLIDSVMVDLGSNFYTPTLQQQWQDDIPKDILNRTINVKI
ncbi:MULTISPECIES: hypothetical protein [unclassified Acinetobacter]|uniref:hypothetical protein n=1 Tax=unclassified Acinetobacter TaxID=196816 RepID=UPI0035BA1FFA